MQFLGLDSTSLLQFPQKILENSFTSLKNSDIHLFGDLIKALIALHQIRLNETVPEIKVGKMKKNALPPRIIIESL